MNLIILIIMTTISLNDSKYISTEAILNMTGFLDKTYCALGATTSFLDTKYNNDNVIIGAPLKLIGDNKALKHSYLLNVKEGVTINDIRAYVECKVENNEPIKIMSTYDSMGKVKAALGNFFDTCFLLFDEVDMVQSEASYRSQAIFRMLNIFKNHPEDRKLAMSATTPAKFYDSYLENLRVEGNKIMPERMKTPVAMINSKNLFTTLVKYVTPEVKFMRNSENAEGKYLIYANSIELIAHSIEAIVSQGQFTREDINVYCADNDKNRERLGDHVKSNFSDFNKVNFCTDAVVAGADADIDATVIVLTDASNPLYQHSRVSINKIQQFIGRVRGNHQGILNIVKFETEYERDEEGKIVYLKNKEGNYLHVTNDEGELIRHRNGKPIRIKKKIYKTMEQLNRELELFKITVEEIAAMQANQANRLLETFTMMPDKVVETLKQANGISSDLLCIYDPAQTAFVINECAIGNKIDTKQKELMYTLEDFYLAEFNDNETMVMSQTQTENNYERLSVDLSLRGNNSKDVLEDIYNIYLDEKNGEEELINERALTQKIDRYTSNLTGSKAKFVKSLMYIMYQEGISFETIKDWDMGIKETQDYAKEIANRLLSDSDMVTDEIDEKVTELTRDYYKLADLKKIIKEVFTKYGITTKITSSTVKQFINCKDIQLTIAGKRARMLQIIRS